MVKAIFRRHPLSVWMIECILTEKRIVAGLYNKIETGRAFMQEIEFAIVVDFRGI